MVQVYKMCWKQSANTLRLWKVSWCPSMKVRKNLSLASEVMQRKYDHRLQITKYHEGDLFWFYRPHHSPGSNAKLSRPWIGPCVVFKQISDILYRVKIGPKSKARVIHLDQMKPYLGGSETTVASPPRKHVTEKLTRRKMSKRVELACYVII